MCVFFFFVFFASNSGPIDMPRSYCMIALSGLHHPEAPYMADKGETGILN